MKKTNPEVPPVCIAGAHRSGTSMVTRLLHESGLELGPAGDLMPPQVDNPDGFWENLRFVAINDEVLNELGGAWDLPPSAKENFKDARLDPLRLKARVLIESFGTATPWGWKDPRNSLTLPFWNSLLPTLKVVVMVRNPLEVAYSLQKRNGTSYAFGLRLWDLYNRRLLAATTKTQRLISNYDSFFTNPEAELNRIAQFIGLPEDRIPAAILVVARNRRHTSFTVEQLVDARVSSETIELYRALIAPDQSAATIEISRPPEGRGTEIFAGPANPLRVSVPDAEEVREELAALRGAKQEHQRLRDDLPHLQQIAQQKGRIRELQESLATRERESGEAARQLEIQATEIGSLRERFQQAESETEALRGRLGQNKSETEVLRERLRQNESETEILRERISQAEQQLQSRSLSLAEQEGRVVNLTDRLREQAEATVSLAGFLDRIEAAAARLRSSRRWKLSNPVATLRNALFRRPLFGPSDLERTVSTYAQWKHMHPRPKTFPSTALAPPRYAPPVLKSFIEFPVHQNPDISIIIPVFNQLSFTQACLASIQEHAGCESFEVIVVDDSSSDATPEELPGIPGLVYLRNEANAGFITSCNRGAQQARGQFLVFLNNDTQVTSGWLSALRETFALHPRAGLVGSKLLFPDRRLQEAGGIVWRDASAWNYGKFDDPGKPEYNFLREVDYCSGASIMIAKSLFESLGGFDTKYAPAYYEDTDLAFNVRHHGFKVLYQPLSQVIHAEGVSHGTDLAVGTKRYQEINRSTFAITWADVLADKPVNGDLAAHHAPKPGQQRILVVDHHLPMPDRDSGSLRMSQILRILRELGHQVSFIPDNLADMPPYTAALQKLGIEVIHHPYLSSVRGYLETHGARFDLVILSRCDVARKHIADVRAHAPQSRVLFDTVDLHFLRQDREGDLLADREMKRMARERQALEYNLIDQADQTWVVSEFEQELLRRERPNKSIELVSNIVDVQRSTTPFSLRHDFLFVGSFQHPPNGDAVLFFAGEILPLIQRRLPAVKFYVIGDKAPPAVRALASENVIITGWQPEIRPYFDRVKLSVAPLRWGAGVKGKINQSLGLGVPVVATSVAAEGMGLTNGRDILLADTIEAFAHAVIELYETEDLWTGLSERGLETSKAKYSPAAARKQLARLLGERSGTPDLAGDGHDLNQPGFFAESGKDQGSGHQMP